MERLQIFLFFKRRQSRRAGTRSYQEGRKRSQILAAAAVALAESYGMSPQELNKLQKVVENNAKIIKRAWYEYFGD
jgi:hypothetical protein